MFVGVVAFGFVKTTVRNTVTDTVTKRERVQDGDTSRYLVFGENEVYQNTDSLWLGKFNSSDFYRDIKPEHTYKLEVTGWRVPLMSWYRNIVKYDEVKGR
jgi:hypothetical protein